MALWDSAWSPFPNEPFLCTSQEKSIRHVERFILTIGSISRFIVWRRPAFVSGTEEELLEVQRHSLTPLVFDKVVECVMGVKDSLII